MTPHAYATRRRIQDPQQPPRPLTLLVPRRIRPLGAIAPNVPPPLVRLRLDKSDKDRADLHLELLRSQLIDFPPAHVVLHPEDAASKVFLALGRALWAANNRAMTVKDLAEQAMRFGLVCQNASAAAQAITSFIRNHLHRCDVEQDCPLLLRLVLSGTTRDDSLAPALFSRSGGNVSKDKVKEATDRIVQQRLGDDENHSVLPRPERSTCFRRGTTVWYLSRAAGAECPFARCGIALRDYVDVEEEKHLADGVDESFAAGLKRKRHREGLRTRNADGSVVTGRAEGRQDDLKQGRKPLKVRLTLRLKPLPTAIREKSETLSPSESDSSSDDEDSVRSSIPPPPSLPSHPPIANQEDPSWSLPPYPIHRRISIPPYTPCTDAHSSYDWPKPPSAEWPSRSFSVPLSAASPPPDSEVDEDDDYHFLMTHGMGEGSSSQWGHERVKVEDDTVSDPTGDGIDHPLSETALIGIVDEYHRLSVSSQDGMPTRPRDVESDDIKFGEFPTLTSNLLGQFDQMKLEDSDDAQRLWNSDSSLVSANETYKAEPMDDVDMELDSSLPQPTGSSWKDAEILGPDSVRPEDIEDDEWALANEPPDNYSDSRACSVLHSTFGFVPPFSPSSVCSSPSLSASVRTWSSPEVERDNFTLYSAANTPEMISSAGSEAPSEGISEADSVVDPVMHPLQSLSPLLISATVIHGIPFYHAEAPQSLLRRMTDDCVCLTSLAAFLEVPCPDSASSDYMVALPLDSALRGVWAPLTTAQRFVRSCGSSRAPLLDVFLSDDLASTIPITLRKALFRRMDRMASGQRRRSTKPKVPLSQRRKDTPSRPPLVVNDLPVVISGTSWEIGMITNRDVEEHFMTVQSPFTSSFPRIFGEPRKEQPPELPLSPQEQEILQSLCHWTDPDAESTNPSRPTSKVIRPAPAPVPAPTTPVAVAVPSKEDPVEEESMEEIAEEGSTEETSPPPANLRRSKRAANAVATQRLRTRPRKHASAA